MATCVQPPITPPRDSLQRTWSISPRGGSYCPGNLVLWSNMFKGWMTRQFFWLIRISVSQNLPESNKSSYWAGDVVKNAVKSCSSQMHIHSVEILSRDVNCRKRHHSGSKLVHMCACAICSQSPTSTNLSGFWLLGSKYEHEMGPKTKTNTYEFIEFSFVLTLSLPGNQSEWY